jgi:hypothetical protein
MPRLLVLPALLLALALTACGGESKPQATPAATVALSDAVIHFEYDDSISEQDRRIVREASAEARTFFAHELGRDLKLDVTVEVSEDDGEGFLGFSFGRRAWIMTGSAGWPDGSGRFALQAKQSLVAHELFHNFQSDLQYTDDALPSDSPWWITEGTAEYAAARFTSDAFDVSWDSIVRDYQRSARNANMRLDDPGMRTSRFYSKAFLAIDELMDDRPLTDLGDYFVKTGYMDWEDAFNETFGETPEAFVERFEASRD